MDNERMPETQEQQESFTTRHADGSGSPRASYRAWKWLVPGLIGLLAVLFAGFLLLRSQLFPPAPTLSSPPASTTAAASEPSRLASPTGVPAANGGRVKMTALRDSASGIDPATTFSLSLSEDIPVSVLGRTLSVFPKFSFQLTKKDKDVLLTPDQPLAAGQVYRFDLLDSEMGLDESFAFQTRRDFRVASTLPANQGTNVPVNTGVEIQFSDAGYEGVAERFTLVPVVNGAAGEPVPGRVEIRGDTAAFVPYLTLSPGTVYRGTLSSGVTLASSAQTLQTETVFSFQTALAQKSEQNRRMHLSETLLGVNTRQIPVLHVYADDATIEEPWSVTVWRYPDMERFKQAIADELAMPWWAERSPLREPDAAGLVQQQTFTAKPIREDYDTLMVLPDTLAEGWYVVTCRSGALADYAFVQVQDMSLYLSLAEGSTLGWAHDSITREPLQGVSLALEGGSATETDADGVALLPGTAYPEDGEVTFLTALWPGHSKQLIPLMSPSDGYRFGYHYEYGGWDEGEWRQMRLRNWHYLFQDRSVYLPTDAIGFWGVVQSRTDRQPPESLTVSLVRQDGWSFEDGPVLQTMVVEPGPDGVYEGQFTFGDYESGGYRLLVREGDILTDSAYLSISRYEKPVYVLGASLDNPVHFPGEKVSAALSGRFFEGTPVPGLALETSFSINNRTSEETVFLDATGAAQVETIVPEWREPISWSPRGGWFQMRTRDPEEGDNSQYVSFTVFPRDVMLWGDVDMTDGIFSYTVHTHALDQEKARVEGDRWYGADPSQAAYLGDALAQSVQWEIYEHGWDAKVIGKGYDHVNKVTYDRYDYVEVNRLVASGEAATANGIYAGELTIPDWRKDRSYRMELRCADSKGRPVLETIYPEGYWGSYGYGTDAYVDLGTDKPDIGYRDGETVTVQVRENGVALPGFAEPTSVLYILAREGHLSWEVKSQSEQQFPFRQEWMPNVVARAVLWQQGGIRETPPLPIPYDRTEQALAITVKPDRDAYRPGDPVVVSLAVVDAEGNPVQANVNLSVVDEAYFALYPQEVDPLGALYQPSFLSGIRYSFITNSTDASWFNPGGGAEGGEGDDAGTPVRSAFKDTAWFDSVRTDTDGTATVSFRLPDNLTTFRITAQAMTGTLQAGHTVSHAISRLPFFVQMLMPDTVLAGDVPTVLLRSYGDGVIGAEAGDGNDADDADASVPTRYEVTLTLPDGAVETYSAEGVHNRYVSIPLTALPEGTAMLRVKASRGSLSDAMEQAVHVEKSLLTTPQTRSFALAEGKGIPTEVLDTVKDTQSVSLVISDRQANLAWEAFWRMYGTRGQRVDQVLARQMAATALRDQFEDPQLVQVPQEDFSLWQQADGGVALLPYASSDALLSAKLCSVAPEQFNTNELRRFFTRIAEDKTALPEQAAAALWGRAALGDPVLLEIRGLLENESWEDDETLIFALALADLGDREGARTLLATLIGNHGKEADPLAWVDLGADREAMLRNTALMAMLAQKVGDPAAEGLYRYLMENATRQVPVLLEQLSLMNGRLLRNAVPGGFTVSLDGRTENVTLGVGEQKRFLLTGAQLKGMTLSNLSGELTASMMAKVGVDMMAPVTDAGIEIARSYQVNGKTVETFDATDAVEVVLRVRFDADAPKGGYSLSDLLPAGLRFTGGVYDSGNNWVWWQPDGREVRTALYHKGGASERTLRYRARVSGAGSFSAEAPVMRHDDSEAGSIGVAATVVVNAP